MMSAINKIKYITIAYGLWLLYLLYMTMNAAYIRYDGNVDKWKYIFAFSGGLFLGRLIEVAVTLLFWKAYSLKYKGEKVFENLHRKWITAILFFFALMGIAVYKYGPIFLFITLLLAMRKLKLEMIIGESL